MGCECKCEVSEHGVQSSRFNLQSEKELGN